jgi:hypothetical protein
LASTGDGNRADGDWNQDHRRVFCRCGNTQRRPKGSRAPFRRSASVQDQSQQEETDPKEECRVFLELVRKLEERMVERQE